MTLLDCGAKAIRVAQPVDSFTPGVVGEYMLSARLGAILGRVSVAKKIASEMFADRAKISSGHTHATGSPFTDDIALFIGEFTVSLGRDRRHAANPTGLVRRSIALSLPTFLLVMMSSPA